MNKKSDILFCGLVRKPDLFSQSLSELQKLKKKGLINKILLSTWKGELEKTPEAKELLAKNKVLVIESEEPTERGEGNIWCQMKSLEEGLKKIENNRFVLRTRTDVHINPDFLKKLFSEKERLLNITSPLPKGNVFDCKVWIPWIELTKPFYMGDECFFGLCSDLKKFVNYDTSYDKKYSRNPDISHTRRFIHPFLQNYPIFYSTLGKFSKERAFKNFWRKFSDDFYAFLKKSKTFKKLSEKEKFKVLKDPDLFYETLRHMKTLRKFSESNRFKILNKRLKNKDFLCLLAAYYCVLFSHFYIDSSSFPNQVQFREHSTPKCSSNSQIAEENFKSSNVSMRSSGQLYAYEMGFINALNKTTLEKTPLALALFDALAEFKSQ